LDLSNSSLDVGLSVNNMKGKTLTVFVRFGGLNLKKQRGYTSEQKTYHSPPAPKGFYAMPKIAQEFFLIGGMSHYQPYTVPKHPNQPEDLTDEEADKFWDDFNKRYDRAISGMRKEFTKTKGEIWHHLAEYTEHNEIVSRHGSWVKTSIKAWEKAFSKMSLNYRLPSDDYLGTKNINEARGILGCYSKDHCEVFFDEKV
jgi:hypothetical protein